MTNKELLQKMKEEIDSLEDMVVNNLLYLIKLKISINIEIFFILI